MTTFGLYFSLGFDHIADLAGYDHILFLMALCAVYSLKEWAKVLILVTAFTLGHTLTLALATLDQIRISTSLIEFLIPVTIIIAGIWNILQRSGSDQTLSHRFKYSIALFFGLIHGLGFSNYLRSLLGTELDLLLPLFSFNLGLELGQIMIVLVVLLVSFVLVNLFGMKRREWNLLLSGAAIGVSLILCVERWPF
ncbi:MAG: HupE/UreJ family protein [Bacteroidales bacterium]|nr:HupE/UreJ family protein [Bacteroidales bacterium]